MNCLCCGTSSLFASGSISLRIKLVYLVFLFIRCVHIYNSPLYIRIPHKGIARKRTRTHTLTIWLSISVEQRIPIQSHFVTYTPREHRENRIYEWLVHDFQPLFIVPKKRFVVHPIQSNVFTLSNCMRNLVVYVCGWLRSMKSVIHCIIGN